MDVMHAVLCRSPPTSIEALDWNLGGDDLHACKICTVYGTAGHGITVIVTITRFLK